MADPAALSSGTVAFLITDLEGSTRHLEAHPDAPRAAVRRHHQPPVDDQRRRRWQHQAEPTDAVAPWRVPPRRAR